MIQRVQSLFLLASAILLIVFLFVPIWEKKGPQKVDPSTSLNVSEKAVLSAFHVSLVFNEAAPDNSFKETLKASASTWYIGTLAVICAVISLFSIFQYNNRMTQIKLGLLNTLLICGIVGIIFLGIKQGEKLIQTENNEDFQIGFFLPAIALLFNSLANRFIRKDEQLVRSADRLR